MDTVTVCVWFCPTCEGWHWDDSEDHGGFDRISPMGPFPTDALAVADARAMFPRSTVEVEEGSAPLHYVDTDEPEHLDDSAAFHYEKHSAT